MMNRSSVHLMKLGHRGLRTWWTAIVDTVHGYLAMDGRNQPESLPFSSSDVPSGPLQGGFHELKHELKMNRRWTVTGASPVPAPFFPPNAVTRNLPLRESVFLETGLVGRVQAVLPCNVLRR